MSEIKRLMEETNRLFHLAGIDDIIAAALTAERAERERVEKSLRAQLATEIDETQKARAEVERLRGALKACIEEYSYAAEYKGEYLREKHGDDDRIAEWRKLLPKEAP